MTAAAALHSFHQGHRLPVSRGHGFHGRPGKGVLSLLELLDPLLMTIGTCIRCRDLNFGDIIRILVLFTVTGGTVDFILTVFADLPIGDDIRSHLFMAFDTFLSVGTQAKNDAYQDSKYCLFQISPPWLLSSADIVRDYTVFNELFILRECGFLSIS